MKIDKYSLENDPTQRSYHAQRHNTYFAARDTNDADLPMTTHIEEINPSYTNTNSTKSNF